MKTWQDELAKVVEAGEREFGPLDAHQTVRHNLVRRCEEILAEETVQANLESALPNPRNSSAPIG